MNIPNDLLYSTDHEWVRVDGDTATVGITDYAQDALGDVVYIDLPAAGRTVSAGEMISEIESTKSVSEIIAPLAGEITEANEAAGADPTLVNSDPYGAGWLVKIRVDPTEIEHLLDAAAYAKLISD